MAFWELSVPVCEEIAEGLTNFLWEAGAMGVVEEEAPGAPGRLRAFFPDGESTARLLGEVNAYLAGLVALGFPRPAADAEIHPLRDEAWASAWQASFSPRPVGERLLVVPPWATEATAEAGRLLVVVEPGRAFGTGQHGSTEGCLALLERELPRRRPAGVLDLGTGSGILALAALVLGAPRVVAVDVDADAVAAARKNAASNRCADRLDVRLGGVEAVEADGAFDLVLANLLAHTHLALGPRYPRLVAAGGLLVLGGMLEEEDRPVAAALAPLGFREVGRVVCEGWAALALERAS